MAKQYLVVEFWIKVIIRMTKKYYNIYESSIN